MAKTKGSVSVSYSPDIRPVSSADIDIYADDIDLYLSEFLDMMGIDRQKISSMQWAAALRYICNHTFKRDNSCLLARSSGLACANDYNIIAVNALCDRYIDMCYTYGQRICVEHFSFLSGIAIQTLYQWSNDNRVVYVYSDIDSKDVLSSSVVDGKRLTIRRNDIYKKLVQNTIIAADDLVLSKAGVNSIAYRNAVQERYASRAADQVQALDVGSIADQLGIASDVALLSDSSK